VAYASQLIEAIGEQVCIDLNSVFVSGASNGGMVSFEIAAGLPDKIAALVPVFGLPTLGTLAVPNQLRDTSYLFLSGRQDRVVPIDASLSNAGWYYEAYDTASKAYSAVHGCDQARPPSRVETPADGVNNLACVEYHDCVGGRVMDCEYTSLVARGTPLCLCCSLLIAALPGSVALLPAPSQVCTTADTTTRRATPVRGCRGGSSTACGQAGKDGGAKWWKGREGRVARQRHASRSVLGPKKGLCLGLQRRARAVQPQPSRL
jgi:hypothetical protein